MYLLSNMAIFGVSMLNLFKFQPGGGAYQSAISHSFAKLIISRQDIGSSYCRSTDVKPINP